MFVELSEHRETVEDLRYQVDHNDVRIEPCRPLQSRRTVQAFGDNRVGALCFEESAESIGEKWMAAYQEHEDLISIGAYRRGSNRSVDLAIDLVGEINGFLRQKVDEPSSVELAKEGLVKLQQKTVGN